MTLSRVSLTAAITIIAGLVCAPIAAAKPNKDTCAPTKAAAKKHKVEPAKRIGQKARPIQTKSTIACDCKPKIRGEAIKPVETAAKHHDVAVYRAPPRKWHAPYVGSREAEAIAWKSEDAGMVYVQRETTRRRVTRRVRHYHNDYLAIDTRSKHHKWTRWPKGL